MSTAVGIDLGSTFSVISYVKTDGSVEVIPNAEGDRITPSVFAVDSSGQFLVGNLAVNEESSFPERTVRLIKRKMSNGFAKLYTYESSLYLSPVEISAEILKKLKRDAEDYLGETITDAVITVPAYFNNSQRTATKSAGELAGMNVLRIINEPTAASLAYGLDKKNDATILVYDLGGGTFDVTILRLTDGCDFHVLSTSGDTQLGGSDFDDELTKIIIQKLEEKNIFCDTSNDYLMSEIRYHSEKAKKTLSQLEKVNITIPLLRQQYGNVAVSLSREEFENAIDKYLLKTRTCILQTVKDAEIVLSDIDEVVFVGGSTRIPYVSKKVQEWTGKKPNKSINPDEAVSVGAAIQASVLSGSSDKEVYLIDVCPLSLGVETQGGVMATLISRNTQVPAVVKEIFTTAFDNQDLVEVKVFQGERPLTKDNIILGQFTLDKIKKSSRGIPKIEVSFQIDADGVLSVSAQDSETEIQKSLEINQSSLSAEEIKKILKSAEENKVSDENLRLILNLQAQVQDYEIQVTELLKTKLFNSLESEELKDIQKSLKMAESSQNLELLKGIVSSAKTLVQDMSKIVYDRAKENLSI